MVGLQRLGGAGLAADAVALHPGILAGAAVHHLLQDRTAALTGLRADHLSHLVGLIVLEHIALAVGHLADHIGLHQVAAVDDGGGRCDELNRGHLEPLAEGCGGQLDGVEVLPGPDQGTGVHLALHVDAGFLQESEVLQIVIELLRSQSLADLDEGRVAGVRHRQGQILVPVARRLLGATDGPGPALYHDVAGAVEVAVLGDHALLQGGGQDDGLESGARLVGAADGAVGPLCIQHLGLRRRNGFVPGLLAGSPLCQCLLVGLLLSVTATLDVFQVLVEHRVAYRPRVVQVKSWGVCPSQDFSRIGVHGDAEAAVLHLELLDALFQDALTVGLDSAVQGQGQIVAVSGVVVVLIAVEHLCAVAVFGGDDPPRFARESVVVLSLNAIGTVIIHVGVHKADHLGRQAVLGIVTLGGGRGVNAGDMVFVDEGDHRVPLVVLHPPLYDLIHGAGLGQAIEDVRLVQIQELGQVGGNELVGGLRVVQCLPILCRVRRLLSIRLLAGQDLFGGELDVVDRGAHGQSLPASVVDGAPVGLHRAVGGLLLHRHSLVFVVVADLDLPEPDQQRHERRHAEQCQQEQGAHQNGAVRPPVRLLLDHTLSLSVCHGWLTSLKKSRLPLPRGIG